MNIETFRMESKRFAIMLINSFGDFLDRLLLPVTKIDRQTPDYVAYKMMLWEKYTSQSISLMQLIGALEHAPMQKRYD